MCAYIRNPLKAQILKDLSGTSTTWFQQLWLQVQYKKIRSFVICAVYRPPDCHVSCFEDFLKPSSTHALSLNKPVIILGDLNYNLLQQNPDGLSLLNFVSELNLEQLITSPTRTTEFSESLIDVVISSTPDLVQESGVIETCISDHFSVYMVLNLKLPKQPRSYITVRSFKNYNPMLFTADLVSKHETLLQSIFTESDVNSKLSILNDALLSTLQTHAPVKTIRVRNRPCPYITQNIKDLMAHRDQLHREFKFSRDIGDWSTYKNARQSVKIALKNAEKEYVRGEVLAHKNNTTSLWKIINRCIPSKERKIQCYSKDSKFKEIGWLPVKEHLLFKDLVMIYKCANGLAPTYLRDLFLKRKELNNHGTRNNEALHIPLFSTATGQRSFRYRAVGLWNSLDNELKKLPLATFKIKLKELLLSRYFET